MTMQQQLYTSAPILDYDDEPDVRPEDHEVLDAAEASDHDILRGAALEHTAFLKPPPHF